MYLAEFKKQKELQALKLVALNLSYILCRAVISTVGLVLDEILKTHLLIKEEVA